MTSKIIVVLLLIFVLAIQVKKRKGEKRWRKHVRKIIRDDEMVREAWEESFDD